MKYIFLFDEKKIYDINILIQNQHTQEQFKHSREPGYLFVTCFNTLRKTYFRWWWFTDIMVEKCWTQNLLLFFQDIKAYIHENLIIFMKEFCWSLQLVKQKFSFEVQLEIQSEKDHSFNLEEMPVFMHPNIYRNILFWGHLRQKWEIVWFLHFLKYQEDVKSQKRWE